MRKLLIASTVITSSLVLSSSAYALTNSARTASVQIVEPLSMTVGTDLAFGKIQRPTTGSVTAVLSTAGALTGTATSLGGTVTKGSYTIIGDATQTIGITITAGAAVEGITLGSFDQRYNGGATSFTNGSTQVAPGTGKALLLGATLTVPSTATAGVKSLAYNIDVVYQ